MNAPQPNGDPRRSRQGWWALAAVFVLLSGVRAQEVVRTGEIAARGLKNSDFPRITKLADRVYAYELTQAAISSCTSPGRKSSG